ncbi:large ribosomal subunit protein mL42-like [Babylonia areolata]|uniref:large ribosomal subunit protein mL42-like n=1 Tax=Babylonia areolata TaxID=304850 RepID=UPI003FD1A4BE
MAASLTRQQTMNFLRIVSGFRSQLQRSALFYGTSCKDLEVDSLPRIAVAPDQSCIICWHPEPEHPYHCTQPVPRMEESAEGDSPLKVNLCLEEKLRLRPDGPTDHELCNMFFTTKHQWRPMTQKKYRKPQRPLDREGL